MRPGYVEFAGIRESLDDERRLNGTGFDGPFEVRIERLSGV